MKKFACEIINSILNSESPIALLSLTNILLPFSEQFDPSFMPSEDFAAHWRILSELFNKVRLWQLLDKEQQLLSQLRIAIAQLQGRYRSNQQKIGTNTKLIQEKNALIKGIYTPLYEDYTQALLIDNPLLALPCIDDVNSQLLKDYLVMLLSKQAHRQIGNLRMTLDDKLTQHKDLVFQLQQFGFHMSSTTPADMSQLLEMISSQKNDLDQIKPELQKMLQLFSAELSIQDVMQNIKALEKQITEEEQLLSSISSQLSSSTIDNASKTLLTEEYVNAINKEEFITQQKTELDWSISAWNVKSWYTWGTDQQFNDKLLERQNTLDYLKLFYAQEEQKQLIEKLKQKLLHTTSFIDGAVVDATSFTNSQLHYQQAVDLLKAFDKNYLPAQDGSFASLLADIIVRMGPLSEQIDKLAQSISLLKNLIEIDKAILSIRTTYSLIPDSSNSILTNSDILDLQQTATAREQELQQLADKIAACEHCIACSQQIDNLALESRNLREINRKIKADYKNQLSQLADQPNDHDYSVRCETTKSEIVKIIHSLRQLPPIHQTISPVDLEHVDVESDSLLEDYHREMAGWHRQINALIRLLPQDLNLWYQQLYATLQLKINNEETFLQICQLLRDIHFELKYTKTSEEYHVLRAYQQICPVPNLDWQALTSTKPALPLNFNIETKISLPHLQRKIDNLYNQQQHLAKKHPREATLLLHATYNLHQIALLAQNNEKHSALKNLGNSMADPRYHYLERHRGFLRIGEYLAELCTSLLNNLKISADKNYQHRFFFTPTRTSQLLQETTSILVC